ncbi:restriction endonuclease subunit S [Methanobrevibacter smithii]
MRFSGFDDEWKTYKLKDLLHNKSSSISINQLDDNVGNYPLYGASGFLKCIDFYEMDSDYISIVKDGSGVGNISFHEKNTSVVNTSQYILPKENLNIHFIFYLLQTINLNKYKTGSTIPHIYFKDYSIEKVKIPKYDEQKKIGILLKNLDAKIEILDNKLQMCQNFKKYLMQQIFTQKLRFTDYIEEWKTIKLKDVGEINTGNTPSTKVNEYYSPKKYLWVTPSDISSKYIFDTAKRLSDEGAKKGRFVKKIVY